MAERQWFITDEEFDSTDDFRVAVAEELARLENMGCRLGRGFIVTPIRRPRTVGQTTVYDTIGWGFREVFMPALRAEEQPEDVDLGAVEEPEPEPVGVE